MDSISSCAAGGGTDVQRWAAQNRSTFNNRPAALCRVDRGEDEGAVAALSSPRETWTCWRLLDLVLDLDRVGAGAVGTDRTGRNRRTRRSSPTLSLRC